MPKITIEFQIPEEREELDLALKAPSLASCVSDLDDWLRRKLKYEELTEEQSKIYTEVRDKLMELQND